MSHALALVVVPPEGDINEHLAALLERWREEYQDADGNWQRRDEGWYDWYQVGGRWTGVFSRDYNPETDPANLESCNICGGTGTRDWSKVKWPTDQLDAWIAEMNGCNGCNGVGMKVKWPTDWVDHAGDVVPVPVALAYAIENQAKGACFTVVSGEKILHRRVWHWDEVAEDGHFTDTDDFDAKVTEILTEADPTWRVAAVDYHN